MRSFEAYKREHKKLFPDMTITESDLRIMHKIRRHREELEVLLPGERYDHQTRK